MTKFLLSRRVGSIFMRCITHPSYIYYSILYVHSMHKLCIYYSDINIILIYNKNISLYNVCLFLTYNTLECFPTRNIRFILNYKDSISYVDDIMFIPKVKLHYIVTTLISVKNYCYFNDHLHIRMTLWPYCEYPYNIEKQNRYIKPTSFVSQHNFYVGLFSVTFIGWKQPEKAVLMFCYIVCTFYVKKATKIKYFVIKVEWFYVMFLSVNFHCHRVTTTTTFKKISVLVERVGYIQWKNWIPFPMKLTKTNLFIVV